MDQNEYNAVTGGVFGHSQAGHGSLLDNICFTNDGVLSVSADTRGTLGFGIASGMTLSTQLVATVELLNRTMTFGHYWLAEGQGDSNWSLICGFKFNFDSTSTDGLMQIAIAVMQHSGVIVDSCRKNLESIPHTKYWHQDVDFSAQAFVLLGHLA